MTFEQNKPDEAATTEPDEAAMPNLDGPAKFDDLAEDSTSLVAEAGSAARSLGSLVAGLQSPAYLESTRRLSEIVAKTQAPAFLKSSRQRSDLVAGTGLPRL